MVQEQFGPIVRAGRSLGMMTDQLVTDITDAYYASLTNKHQKHPKRVVLFSGVAGSGKSTVARAIEENLRGIRLSNDDVRDRITTAVPAIDLMTREEIKLQIATALLERVVYEANGLVVIDVACDRGYDYYKQWSEKYGYRIILLRMDVPRDIIEERIQSRGKLGYRDVDASLEMLDTWWRQWEDFGKSQTPDLVITPSIPIEKVLKVVEASLT